MFTLIAFTPLMIFFFEGIDTYLLKTLAAIFGITFFVVMGFTYLTEGLLSALPFALHAWSLGSLVVVWLALYAWSLGSSVMVWLALYAWSFGLLVPCVVRGLHFLWSDLLLLYLLLSWNPILAIFPISMAICLWILKIDSDKSLSVLLFSTFILWVGGSYAYFAYERPTIENDAIALLFNTYEAYDNALTTNEK